MKGRVAEENTSTVPLKDMIGKVKSALSKVDKRI